MSGSPTYTTRSTHLNARQRTTTLGLVLGFLTFGALGVLVPFLILAEPDHYRSAGWMLTLAILFVSALRLSVLIGLGERRLFEFIFWLFNYVFFGLAPSVQIRQDQMPGTTKDLDPALDVPTGVLACVGILCLALGFALAHRRVRGHEKSVRSSRLAELQVNQTRLVLLSVVGVAGSLYYVAKVGVGTLFGSRAGSSLVEDQLWPDSSVAGIVRAISSFPILVAAHGWWLVAQRREGRGLRRSIAAGLTVVTMLVTNPLSSSRYSSGVVWGSFLGPAGAYRTRRSTSITSISVIGGLLFLFPVADLFRRIGQVNVARSGFLSEYANNGDYDAFGQLSNALLYNQTEPLAFGRQFLGQLLFWVPRSIWTDKPVGTGVLLAQFRGYTFTNLSAPIWAEMLLNFGLVGVVVASVLMGYGLAKLDIAFQTVDPRGVLGIATAVLPFYLLILLRGSLLQATGTLTVIVGSLVFIAARPSPAGQALGRLPSSTAGAAAEPDKPPQVT